MSAERPSVAIDGPAGSGKSTVAARLAERLGYDHVDTGAMYRCLTAVALRESLDLESGPTLADRLAGLDLRYDEGRLLLEGQSPGEEIRGERVTALVSGVSAHPEVRLAMQRRQRELAWTSTRGVVMEGRDIGSQVLPMATCKIYLDAKPEERARRRAEQDGRPTEGPEFETLLVDLVARDHRDSSRPVSPLRISPDARVLDTTQLDLEAVVDRCAQLVGASQPPPVDDATLAPFRFRRGHYRVAYEFVRGLCRWVYGLKIHGAENERYPKGVIYASNHISWWDPPVLGSGVGRETHYLAKKELFVGPLGWLISTFNAIPIVRGRYDPHAFDKARGLLRDGENLAIFPEGTRKPEGKPGPMKKGLGILAMETGAPYMPCYVRGTRGILRCLIRRQKMELWIGPPVELHALERLREDLSDSEIQGRVGELFLAQVKAFMHRAEYSDRV